MLDLNNHSSRFCSWRCYEQHFEETCQWLIACVVVYGRFCYRVDIELGIWVGCCFRSYARFVTFSKSPRSTAGTRVLCNHLLRALDYTSCGQAPWSGDLWFETLEPKGTARHHAIKVKWYMVQDSKYDLSPPGKISYSTDKLV